MTGMTARFVIEVRSEGDYQDIQTMSAQARASAGATGVRFVRAVYVPEDATCLLIIEAPDENAAHAFLERAGLQAISVDKAATTRSRTR